MSGRVDNSRCCYRRSRSRIVWIVSVIALTLVSQPAISQDPLSQTREYKMKAVQLYGLARHTSWPEVSFSDTQGAFVLGILGKDPFGATIDAIAQRRKVNGRTIEVARMESADDFKPCHLVFVTQSVDDEQLDLLMEYVMGRNVLLVGESPGFADSTGTVNFFLEEGAVRFEINMERAQAAGLTFDAQLLTAGQPVGRSQPQ